MSKPVSYNVLGHPITAAMRLETLDRLLAAHDADKARAVRTSHHGEREWLERRARYLAEREEMKQRLALEDRPSESSQASSVS